MKVTGFNIGTREGKLKAAARDLREAVVNNGYSSIIDLGSWMIVDIIRPYFKHSYKDAENFGPRFMETFNDIIGEYNKMYKTNESI